MGRPLNKKFFGNAADKLLGSAYLDNSGAPGVAAVSIVRQRSNLKYEVQAETGTTGGSFTAGVKYVIVSVGSTDFTAIGAESNTVGLVFTATGAGSGTGVAAERAICKLQAATPAALGEMRIQVTPENATATVQATVDITSAGGTGALTNVTINNAGYGYWADGTNVALGGTTDGTIDYTVDGNGSLATVSINTAGSANTQANGIDIGDAPATNPPVQYARIINARQVKCFPAVGGSTFAWPALAPLGGFRGPHGEADIELQT
jgi:hypothetical protein